MILEKILQSQGFGSRKQVRLLIEKGRVAINQEICKNSKADFALDHFEFSVDGVVWQYREKIYIALHKPQGYECSHNPQHHKSVFSLLPASFVARGVQCVGRLDQDTTGLLLMTDDGRYLHALTHPRKHVPKRYRVLMQEPIKTTEITQLYAGVQLQDQKELLAADACEQIDSHTLCLTIHQGVYHQVKRMIAAVGNHVVALHREQIGQFDLADLPEGAWVFLDEQQQQSASRFTPASDQ